jgi:hypothetical protein
MWLERLRKYCSQFGARIFGFWRGFGEGAGLKNPVTEPKQSQKSKRPLFQHSFPNGYSIFFAALKSECRAPARHVLNPIRAIRAIRG